MENVQTINKPNEVELRPSNVEIGKPGLWCVKKVKEGSLFGPYEGEIVLNDKKSEIDYRYAWEVWNSEENKLLYIINANKNGNWMKYVNCARYFEEQNLVSVQINNEIYYKAIKDIEIGEELLTWYDLSDRDTSKPDNKTNNLTRLSKMKSKENNSPKSPKKSSKISPKKSTGTQIAIKTNNSPKKMNSLPPTSKRKNSSSENEATPFKKTKEVQTTMNFKISKKSNDKSLKTSESESNKLVNVKEKANIFKFHIQKKHHSFQDGKKMYACEICNVVYKRPFSLKRHFLRTHINCRYICDNDITNCCIDLSYQVMQIENAQKIQASGTKLYNGLKQSHTSTPNKKDATTYDLTNGLPGLYKCDECFFVFDDSEHLIAHSKCHDSKTGSRRQSSGSKRSSIQKPKHLQLPYSLKESFDSLHISDISKPANNSVSFPEKNIIEVTGPEENVTKDKSSSKKGSRSPNKKSTELSKSPIKPSCLSSTKLPIKKTALNVSTDTPNKKNDTTSLPCSKKEIERKLVKSPQKVVNMKLNSEATGVKISENQKGKKVSQKESLKRPGVRKTRKTQETKCKSDMIESISSATLHNSPKSMNLKPKVRTDPVSTPRKNAVTLPVKNSNLNSPFSPKQRTKFGSLSPRKSPRRSPFKRKARGSKYVKSEFKKFPCPKCSVKFSRQKGLEKHLKEHIENKSCPCYICGKQFMSETKMKQHARYHFSQNVSCRHCDLKFPNVGAMRQHLLDDHEDKWLINSVNKTDSAGKPKKKAVQRSKIQVVSEMDFRNASAKDTLPIPVIPPEIPKSKTPSPRSNFKVLSSPVAVLKRKNVTIDNSPAPNGYKSKLRYSCFTCKKRFISYYALGQHRRTNHRYNIYAAPSILLHMKQKVSEQKNPVGNMPMLSPPVSPDPYYNQVSENVLNNLSHHIDGKSEALKKFRKHIMIKGYKSINSVTSIKTEPFNWSTYNFPFHFEPYESVIGYSNCGQEPIIVEDLGSSTKLKISSENHSDSKHDFSKKIKLDIPPEAAPILPCMTSPIQPPLHRSNSNDSDSKSMPSLSPTNSTENFFVDSNKEDDAKNAVTHLNCRSDVPTSCSSNSKAYNNTSALTVDEKDVPILQLLDLIQSSEKEKIEHSLNIASKSTPAQVYAKELSETLKSQSVNGYYSETEFGKLGDIVNVCSVCYRYFDTEESLVRHQWTRHSSMSCRYLQMEKGHDIDSLFYPWPSNEGMVASSTPVPEDCYSLESYQCTYCKSNFKNINRLHVHIISCDPQKIFYVERQSVKERKKQEAKERKEARELGKSDKVKNLPSTTDIKSKLDKRRKKEKLKKIIRDRIAGKSPNKGKEVIDKQNSVMSPRSLREVRRNEMDLLSNSENRVTRQRKHKNYELLYVPKNHIRRRATSKVVDTHQCSGCSSKFRTLFLLERHARECSQKDKLKDDPKDVQVNSTFKHTCQYCERQFTYVKSLSNHYQNTCPVKKRKIEKKEITDSDLQKESEMIVSESEKITEDPEPTKQRCGWPKGLKRKNRRKNHSWTYIKKKKTSSEESDANNMEKCGKADKPDTIDISKITFVINQEEQLNKLDGKNHTEIKFHVDNLQCTENHQQKQVEMSKISELNISGPSDMKEILQETELVNCTDGLDSSSGLAVQKCLIAYNHNSDKDSANDSHDNNLFPDSKSKVISAYLEKGIECELKNSAFENDSHICQFNKDDLGITNSMNSLSCVSEMVCGTKGTMQALLVNLDSSVVPSEACESCPSTENMQTNSNASEVILKICPDEKALRSSSEFKKNNSNMDTLNCINQDIPSCGVVLDEEDDFYSAETETDTDTICYNDDTDLEEGSSLKNNPDLKRDISIENSIEPTDSFNGHSLIVSNIVHNSIENPESVQKNLTKLKNQCNSVNGVKSVVKSSDISHSLPNSTGLCETSNLCEKLVKSPDLKNIVVASENVSTKDISENYLLSVENKCNGEMKLPDKTYQSVLSNNLQDSDASR